MGLQYEFCWSLDILYIVISHSDPDAVKMVLVIASIYLNDIRGCPVRYMLEFGHIVYCHLSRLLIQY